MRTEEEPLGRVLCREAVLRTFAAAACACVMIAGCTWLTATLDVRSPFVWPDLAVVHVAACWPMAAWTRAHLSRLRRGRLLILLSSVLIVGAALPAAALPSGFMTGVLRRTFLAGGVTLLSQALIEVCLPARREACLVVTRGAGVSVLTSVLAVLLPAMYGYQRTLDELTRFGERLDQQRLGTAAIIAEQVLTIRPEATFRNQSLESIAQQLRAHLAELRRELHALADHDDSAVRMDRAILHAICSDSTAAEAIAMSLSSDATYAADAALLLGTLYEERNAWRACRDWYGHAWTLLASQPHRQADQVRALNGRAFAERKLGDRPAAEQSYLNALSLVPTARQHFLLAQFYEDIQRGGAAAHHVRTAIGLDPVQFEKPGNALLDKLQLHHTGCLGVYRNRP